MATETNVFAEFDEWTDAFAAFVRDKGKVEPGKYRAYGYKPPGHLTMARDQDRSGTPA